MEIRKKNIKIDTFLNSFESYVFWEVFMDYLVHVGIGLGFHCGEKI